MTLGLIVVGAGQYDINLVGNLSDTEIAILRRTREGQAVPIGARSGL
jgi:hypothetical protein